MVDYETIDELFKIQKQKMMVDLLQQIAKIESEINFDLYLEKALKSIEKLHHE